MRLIPFKNLPAFTEEITLDNTPYVFDFIWNSRDSAWGMSILDREQTPLILGITLVINFELITKFSYIENFPQGQMYVVREDGTYDEIEQNELFNGTCSLIYFEENEDATI